MKHGMTLGTNPRLLLLILPAALFAVAAAGSFFVIPLIPAVVVLVLVAVIDRAVWKILKSSLSSHVSTDDESLTVAFPNEEPFSLGIDEISLTGSFRAKDKRGLFFYSDSRDQFGAVPPLFEDMEGLEAWLREHVPFEDTEATSDTIKDFLKNRFVTTRVDEPVKTIE
jgi:hypothetical protein